ncbi:hypothetical protein [Pseudomonas phage COT4]|uniref:Uncharacterized protein n=1 Tax=Pseudomonas phage M5.1 TaxID=2873460 RepID=A0AAE8XEH8_9CAUD|nr:hypothetical protein QGX13_gp045 [Pseudomonas phage M5.1]UAV89646.1 hypothetical protein M51_45 [Pseudomonas phage M5.1]UAV89915.1 hypothetical protein REC_45 [Pseudomonas phage REC]UGL61245.1 hypothetical protein [Pseudomonas phage COT4]UGL62641.1 hypothetical protein [Pseudomonas phage REC1]
MSKLTKAQREFFGEFARNDIGNALFPILAAQGLEITPEVGNEVLDAIDLSAYVELVGQAFLERADFATIKRVDKIMKSDEFNKVIVASHQVSDFVHEARIAILTSLIPDDEEEKAE